MFKPQHVGLFFTQDHIGQARREQDSEPFRTAFLYLRDREQQGSEATLWNGLRYRFSSDEAAGETAVAALQRFINEPLTDDVTYLDTVGQTIMLAQAFEMTRDHAAWEQTAQNLWLNLFADRVSTLSTSPYKDTEVENLWMAALVMASGVLLEREDIFNEAVDVFKRTVDTGISPRGHIASAVEGKDGGSLYRQILSNSALVMMAEGGAHCGVNLWDYNNRGVSVTTAAVYPIYYFYTPERWTWDEGITLDEAQMLFRRHGGYLEILNRQTGFKDLKPLLEDLRPIYDPRGGGLTTLSHGLLVKKRGLFG
jgi:Alginate lyase